MNNQVFIEAEKRAKYLKKIGVVPGSSILLRAEPCTETIYWLYTCLIYGYVFVPFAAKITNTELTHLRTLSHAAFFVDDTKMAIPSTEGLIHIPEPRPTDVLAILFTSGTTGTPKPIPLTRKNFLANAQAHAAHHGNNTGDTWLCCLPLHHIGGLAIFTRAFFLKQQVVFEPIFNVAKISAHLTSGIVSGVSLVATMLHKILEEDSNFVPHKNLRTILLGGSSTPIEAIKKQSKNFAKLPIITTYGMTETCSQITASAYHFPYDDRQGAGKPLLGVEIKLTGKNIMVRGNCISESCAHANAWLDTGDCGEWDDNGNLHILGRKVEMIISGGENIYPQEIESVVLSHPEVLECAAVGLADEKWGTSLALAFVPKNKNTSPAVTELKEFLAKKIHPWKLPKKYLVLDSLPRNSMNKIMRKEVEKLFVV